MKSKNLQNIFGKVTAVVVSMTLLLSALPVRAASEGTGETLAASNGRAVQYDSIDGLSGDILYDTEGEIITACGGEVHQVVENGKTKWYWFGEGVPTGTPTGTTAYSVHLYSSTDLYNWTKEEDMFRGMSSKDQFETDDYFKELYGDLNEAQKTEAYEFLSSCFTAHLKVLYNEKEGQYVMWGPWGFGTSGKTFIATSKSIKGPFKFIKYCEGVTGFITLFQDADGTAYAVCQGTGGVSLLKLSEDYMNLQGAQQSVSFSMSEGSMFQRNGKYYLLNTMMSTYAVADSLDGPWTQHTFQIDTNDGLINTSTYSTNPTACVLPVETKDGVIYIHMTEKWDTSGQGIARYVWLPIEFQENGEITLKGLENWTLELKDEPVEVTAVKLPESQKTLKIGEEYQINASVEPSNATDTTLTYTSGNGKAATVSDTGLVKAVAVGSAEITVRSANGKTAALQITVEDTGKYASIYGLEDEALYDTEGQPIAACGGEVHQVIENGTKKWYWFGEDMPRNTPTETTTHSVHLYSSTDLYNWTKEEDIFRGMSSKDQFETDDYFKELYGDFNEEQKAEAYEVLSNCFTAHLKVLYNEKEKQYVMWGPVSMETPGVMKTFIATSKSIKGPFKFEKYCDEAAQFVTLFQDADGTAYAVCRGTGGLSLLQLSEDYMDLQGTNHSVVFSMQEGCMFQRNGKYYLLSTQTSKYAVADSLDGPWTEYPFQINSTSGGLINTSEYSINPTACVLPVETKDGVIYIHMTEKWDDLRQEPSRYVWLPIDFQENGEITLKGLKNWTLELKEEEEPKPVEVTAVKLSESQKTLKVGEEYQINASVEPSDATNTTLTYTSGNNEAATVSDTGLVKAIAVGSAEITVKSANGKTATLQITVEAAEEPPVEVTAVKLSDTQKTLKVGEEYQINASVEPSDAADKSLTYTSDNNKVATVSETGLVKANAVGSAKITVKSANGKTAALQITVEEKEKPSVEVTKVKLSETKKTLKVGDKYQINASVEPSNATDKTLTYTSDNKKVATVSETGLVKANAVGSAKITVKSTNGKTATLQITVKTKKPEVQKVLVSVDKLTVGVGEKVQLEAGVYPKNAGDKKLFYKASNNKVKVSQKGVITAQKTGTCKVTISSSNGKKAVVKVTVKKKPSKISLNAKKKTLKKGKKFQIKTKLPKGTASYKITYTSSKKSVAAVSKTGKVTAKKKGNATITVKTYNGKKAVLKVSVK